jgi:hypothetical protein
VDLGRPVALKVLSQQVAGKEDMRSRFLREAHTAAATDTRIQLLRNRLPSRESVMDAVYVIRNQAIGSDS